MNYCYIKQIITVYNLFSKNSTALTTIMIGSFLIEIKHNIIFN